MFGNAERMEQLRNFRPTSKTQLRQFCIWFAEGNVEKARQLYNFYSEGVDLPDTEPTPPSRLQSIKENAADVMGFVRDNQNDIVSAVGFIKSLFGKGNAAQIIEPLTKIN